MSVADKKVSGLFCLAWEMDIKSMPSLSSAMLVLDSSALFSMENLPDDSVCPPGVIDELKRYNDPRIERWGDLLRVSDCTAGSLSIVKEAAKKTGDIGRLSDVDMTVLALAIDVSGTILTDDYSIQNVAKTLNIDYKPVGMQGIKKVEKWNYRCVGCGKWYKESMKECPICGHLLRSHRKK